MFKMFYKIPSRILIHIKFTPTLIKGKWKIWNYKVSFFSERLIKLKIQIYSKIMQIWKLIQIVLCLLISIMQPFRKHIMSMIGLIILKQNGHHAVWKLMNNMAVEQIVVNSIHISSMLIMKCWFIVVIPMQLSHFNIQDIRFMNCFTHINLSLQIRNPSDNGMLCQTNKWEDLSKDGTLKVLSHYYNLLLLEELVTKFQNINLNQHFICYRILQRVGLFENERKKLNIDYI